MKIGLFGISFSNANKGVCALAYSSLFVFEQTAKQLNIKNEYVLFAGSEETETDISIAKQKLNIENSSISIQYLTHFSKRQNRKTIISRIKSCDAIIDFTGGDSFSDIYGEKRFLLYSLYKYIAIKNNIPLILAPQTIGPFKKHINKWIAKKIVKKSFVTMARDDMSAEYTKTALKKEVVSLIDVAFFLPFDKTAVDLSADTKKKIGINVSALLWNGGYSGKNQFELSVDYRRFIEETILKLHDKGYSIYLIPHVLVENEYDSIENDLNICNILKEKYPFLTVSPAYSNPVDIKNYISNMDIFLGSRMHATIAGISSKTKTIPVSYSRKFEGLFNTINYNVGVNLKTLTTEDAIRKLLSYIEDEKGLKEAVDNTNGIIEHRKELLLEEFVTIFDAFNKGYKNSKEIKYYTKFCTGCGACNNKGVFLANNKKGYLRPYFCSDDKINILKDICPCVNYNEENFKNKEEIVWGKYKNVYLGYSRDNELRMKASSGGVITQTILYLLEEKKVDYAIMIKADDYDKTKTQTIITDNVDEIKSCCGSRYSISNPLYKLLAKLDKNKKYVFIGKPCDVFALKNLMKKDEELQRVIPITLSFFCAGLPSQDANNKLVSTLLDGKQTEICDLIYRGNGWPGQAEIVDFNNNHYTMSYEKSWGGILGRDTQNICKFCMDGTGEKADIACGDAWYTVDGKPDFTERDGRNIIFARTDCGDSIIRSMITKGLLSAELQEDFYDYLKTIQPWQFNRKTTMASRIKAYKLCGKKAPKYNKKTLKMSLKLADKKRRKKIFLGTIKRALKNKI
ncbi:MAG: polysaccharide pyruvyl transferase family protein [Clostridia bacterium]|nr:polysaccharide pyruvyl transferase family protein [Clostridia bacterium]